MTRVAVRVWRGLDAPRMEFARIRLEDDRLSAAGTQVGVEPCPYRLRYELETASGFVTSRLAVECEGAGWRRTLDLRREPDGAWHADAHEEGGPREEGRPYHDEDPPEAGPHRGGGDPPAPGGDPASVAGALDCDLGLCPLTNTMPILRGRLLAGGAGGDHVMAWVSVPDLALHRSEQRYEPVRAGPHGGVVRYVGRHRSFTAELELDALGLVVRYPGLAERISAAERVPPRQR